MNRRGIRGGGGGSWARLDASANDVALDLARLVGEA